MTSNIMMIEITGQPWQPQCNTNNCGDEPDMFVRGMGYYCPKHHPEMKPKYRQIPIEQAIYELVALHKRQHLPYEVDWKGQHFK